MDRTKEIFKVNCKNRKKIDTKCKFIKVDSPIAKIPIKPSVWKVHLNSKQHRQNVELAKGQRIGVNNCSDNTLNTSKSKEIPLKVECIPHSEVQLQADNSEHTSQSEIKTPQVLPEKFFDHEKSVNIGKDSDPEAEWIKFQREIREAATESNNIVSEEQDSLNIKRHLKEIDEQLENWKRFIKINDKKNDLLKQKHRDTKSFENEVDSSSSSSEECSVDDLLDWRIKSVHK